MQFTSSETSHCKAPAWHFLISSASIWLCARLINSDPEMIIVANLTSTILVVHRIPFCRNVSIFVQDNSTQNMYETQVVLLKRNLCLRQ